jgi:hypothetical protein
VIGEVHAIAHRDRKARRDAVLDERDPAASCAGRFRFVQRFDRRQVLVRCDECSEEWVIDDPLPEYTGAGRC